MKNHVRIVRFKNFKKVQYYSFLIEQEEDEDTVSEIESFLNAYENDAEVSEDLNDLVNWLIEIGDNRGAKEFLFRPEQVAYALPPPARFLEKEVGKLRLYCVWISENIVILANGGIKTTEKAQNCPNVGPKFRFANTMARQINEAIINKELTHSGKLLQGIDNLDLYY